MDEVEMMVKAIEREPDDLTAVSALTDMLQELRDMTHTEAEAHAEKVVQAARDARDLAEAARIIRDDQPWHDELMNDVRELCEVGANEPFTIVLTTDDGGPVAFFDQMREGDVFWMQCIITIGPRWVIRYFRNNPSLFLLGAKQKVTHQLRKRKPR